MGSQTHSAPPPPINEPILDYAPGSPERADLTTELVRQSSEVVEIPLIIGGKEIRKRWVTGYISLAITLLFFIYIIINDIGLLRILIFFPSVVMAIALLEALDKTCIVNIYIGHCKYFVVNSRVLPVSVRSSQTKIFIFSGNFCVVEDISLANTIFSDCWSSIISPE